MKHIILAAKFCDTPMLKTVAMATRHATRHLDRNDIGILLCICVNGDLLLARYFTTGRRFRKLSLATGVFTAARVGENCHLLQAYLVFLGGCEEERQYQFLI